MGHESSGEISAQNTLEVSLCSVIINNDEVKRVAKPVQVIFPSPINTLRRHFTHL